MKDFLQHAAHAILPRWQGEVEGGLQLARVQARIVRPACGGRVLAGGDGQDFFYFDIDSCLRLLRLGAERERLSVIDDQWGAPTGAELIADVSAHALAQLLRQPGKAGIYHLAAAGETSWFSYAKYVFAQARQAQSAIKLIVKDIAAIATADYPTPAQRPHNSRLDCSRLQTVFGLKLPPWQQGVDRMLAEIL